MIYLDNEGCSFDILSAGLLSNSTDGFYLKKGYSIKNFYDIQVREQPIEIIDFLNCNTIFCDPCTEYECMIFRIKEWNSATQFFILYNNNIISPHTKIWFWDGVDIYKVEIINTQRILNDTYYFYQLKKGLDTIYKNINEGVLFILDENKLHLACIEKTPLRKNLKTFLNLLEWYDEKLLNLRDTCYITP